MCTTDGGRFCWDYEFGGLGVFRRVEADYVIANTKGHNDLGGL